MSSNLRDPFRVRAAIVVICVVFCVIRAINYVIRAVNFEMCVVIFGNPTIFLAMLFCNGLNETARDSDVFRM